MKNIHNIWLVTIFVLICSKIQAQENVFLDRTYWKSNPGIEQIDKDIAAGNDPAALNRFAFDAISYALLEKVRNSTIEYLLTKKGNDVNKKTHDGRTYIFWAIYRDNLEMMQFLLEKGARTDIIDSHGYSLLNFAAVTGQKNTKLYDFCIKNGANPMTEKNNDGANPLLLVAPFLEDETLITYFVDKGIDIHSQDDNGNGIFNYAAKKGNTKILELLIKKGVAYKTLNTKGGNAFIFASQGTRNSANNLELYQYLENVGIRPGVVTTDGVNSLHALAFKNKEQDIFDYFIKKGVDINQANGKGDTPFSNAVSRNDLKAIKYLIKYVKDIDQSNKIGVTPLMKAVGRNNIDVVNLLLNNGANPLLKDTEGNSLAYYALESYDKKTSEEFDQKITLLLEKGVDFTEHQAEGETLWHLAVKENDVALLEKIEKLNIPLNSKNDEGNTALHLAAMKAKSIDVLKFLLEKGADKNMQTSFNETVFDLASENELLQKQNIELDFLQE
ncbi:ankyrin repeat domain-containing protein [Aquimarina sp. AD1]|uniref:ankyrin repeat domain-containing protein n=1 Tax=Aquimarina sp. (strain AD1) TaxID=1714848 RepID=UPI000E541440|nr:ankyrin repeat domain-containing protein [Aquimarina sp. AD1]AXT58501.1 ankyrin repeat domain-containing protein [Aquimarina sp. AD1]RKN37574.1 ankyrin repeat domain-containing protein [Aquimarina sp. AD1]